MRKSTIKEAEKEYNKTKPKSPFVTFFVTSIAIIIMLSATFAFVVFKTDGFMAVDKTKVSLSPTRPAEVTSVSILSQQVENNQNPPQNTGAQSGSGSNNVPGTPPIQLSLDAEAVRATLAANPTYASKAIAMSTAYQIIALDNQLGPLPAIAVMANIFYEGNLGIVEDCFSKTGCHGFALPSGGSLACTRADLEYLRAWESADREYHGYPCKKGSCGFGCIQWSFDRRVRLADYYLAELGNSDTITDDMRLIAETRMFGYELTPTSPYYTTVSSKVTNNTLEEWTEAMVDYYVCPSGCCPKGNKMTGTGSACQERINVALDIYNTLAGVVN